MSVSFFLMTIGAKASIPYDAIEVSLENDRSWLRLHGNTYVVATDASAKDLFERVHAKLTAHDTLWVIKLDPSERKGSIPKLAADWIRDKLIQYPQPPRRTLS